MTPLACVAKGGHGAVVRIPLERGDVNPSTVDRYLQTPHFAVAREGHEGVVKVLLNFNAATAADSKAPLFRAPYLGSGGIVEVPPERYGVNSNAVDRGDKTPVFIGPQKGHEGVVRILERNDVKPNITHQDGHHHYLKPPRRDMREW